MRGYQWAKISARHLIAGKTVESEGMGLEWTVDLKVMVHEKACRRNKTTKCTHNNKNKADMVQRHVPSSVLGLFSGLVAAIHPRYNFSLVCICRCCDFGAATCHFDVSLQYILRVPTP